MCPFYGVKIIGLVHVVHQNILLIYTKHPSRVGKEKETSFIDFNDIIDGDIDPMGFTNLDVGDFLTEQSGENGEMHFFGDDANTKVKNG